ncbi:MAG: hypothetical protein LBU32_33390 [Clostridiales bacterium]|jgi:hypothetical protein|nr:hypothetical protein [Clostridiales bacterium]
MAKKIREAEGGCGEGERQAAFQRGREGDQPPGRLECACRPEIMYKGHAMPGVCMKKPGIACATGIKTASRIAALGEKRRPAGSENFRAGRCKCVPRIDPARILKPWRRTAIRFKWRAAFYSRPAGAPSRSKRSSASQKTVEKC